VCTVPGHAHLGMKGVLRVGTPKRKAPQPAPASASLKLVKVGDFELPTDVDAPPGDASRLVVVEQHGLAHLLVDGQRRQKPFLDLRPWVLAEGEAGLLSIAFAPDYATSGLVYAFYNDRGGNLRLVELRRSAVDPNTVDPEPRARVAAPGEAGPQPQRRHAAVRRRRPSLHRRRGRRDRSGPQARSVCAGRDVGLREDHSPRSCHRQLGSLGARPA
jgi:Glucose / Sorbosone dehydrogenase